MSVSYTVNEIISGIKRRATIPTNQGLFNDAVLIEFANDEMQQTVVPLIMSVREDYFVKPIDIALTGANPSQFQIPPDAIGMKVRNIGQLFSGNAFVNLPRLSITEINDYRNYGFVVEGNTVKVYAQGLSQVRVYYFKRPLQLTQLNSAVSQISSIDESTNTITISGINPSWSTATELNLIQSYQPFDSIENLFPISAAYPDYEFESVAGMRVGDYITRQGFSPIAQLPVEAQKTLVQATVVKILEAMGDREGMAAAEKKLEENIKSMTTMITPRVDGSPKKIIDNGISQWTGNNKRWRW